MKKMIQKHISLTETIVDILNEIIKEQSTVTNYSAAIRFLALNWSENKNESNEEEIKIAALSKDIKILNEMVAGGFHSLKVNGIIESSDTFIYSDAKKNAEEKIKRATTIKSTLKNTKSITNKRNFY